MPTALDYSAGRPTGAAVKAAQHAGVVRYAGTPGRKKNITRAEYQDMDRNGVGVALVFEDAAGDALKGRSRGVTAAQAIAADAADIGFPTSRPLYFAVDQDITGQMSTVLDYFRGIGSVLGHRPVGVYGEADVLDAVIGAGLASYGWQTVAWSRGRAAKVRHLFQHAGYSYVGGIQADVNDILAADWGQHNAQEDDMPLTPEDITKFVNAMRFRVMATDHDPDNPNANTDTVWTIGGRSLYDHLADARARTEAIQATLADVALKVAAQQSVPVADLAQALLPGLLAGVKEDLADVEHLDENAVADRLAANLAGRLAQQ